MAEEGTPKVNVGVDADEGSASKFFKKFKENLKGLGKAVDDTSKQSVKGFKGIERGSAGAAEAFLESFIVYKTTGSKIAAAIQLISFTLQERLIGRLTLIGGLSIGAIRGLDALARSFRDMTLGAAAGLEELVTQFTPLLGSVDAAKDRVESLQKFAIGTPFNLEDLIHASKSLETLTRGALTTEEGMTMVGDAAAVAGTSFDEMARVIGRAYSLIEAGRPLGFTALRLQELGLVSGMARNKLEAFNETGAKGERVWKVVADELERTSGAMAAMEQNLNTLESNFEDAVSKLKGGFGEAFLEGEKATVKATTKAIEALTPELERVGKDMAVLPNLVDRFKASLLNLITPLIAVKGGISTVVGTLNVMLSAMAGGTLTLGLYNLLAVLLKFKTAGPALLVVKKGFTALLVPIKVVGGLLKRLLLGSLLGLLHPVAAVGAAITALVGIFLIWKERAREAAAAVDAVRKSTEDSIDKLDEFRKTVRTGADAVRYFREQVKALKKAQEQLAAAEESGNTKRITAAREGVKSIRKLVQETNAFDPKTFKLEGSDMEFEVSKRMESQDLQDRAREFNRRFLGSDERKADLKAQIKEVEDSWEKASKEIEAVRLYDEAVTQAEELKSANEAVVSSIEDEIANLQRSIIKDSHVYYPYGTPGPIPYAPKHNEEISRKIAAKEKELVRARNTPKALYNSAFFEGQDTEAVKLRQEVEKLNKELAAGPENADELRARLKETETQLATHLARQKEIVETYRSNVASLKEQLALEERRTAEQMKSLNLARMQLDVQEDLVRAEVAALSGDGQTASEALRRAQEGAEAAEIAAMRQEVEKAYPSATPEDRATRDAEIARRTAAIKLQGLEREKAAQKDMLAFQKEQQAVAASLSGDSRLAERFEEEAAVLRDQVAQARLRQRLVEAGLSSGQIEKVLDADLKLRAAERERDRNSAGNVVASDLTQIGGASRVRGVDPSFDPAQQVRERMIKELELQTEYLRLLVEKTDQETKLALK